MSASWFVEDDTGRRGPFTRKQLRSLRAAYEIRPDAVVVHSTNGKRTTVDELLPEFKTGLLRKVDSPDDNDWFRTGAELWAGFRKLVIFFVVLLPLWIFIELPALAITLVLLLFRTRFQFSLRSLMIFFLFVCPVLGIISNDIASTVRQQQIVKEWGAGAGWRKDPWRFWKSDVDFLEIKNSLASDTQAALDQLPKLRSVHIGSSSNVVLTPTQYQKLFAARQIEYLLLPTSCSDSDLAGIVELSKLKTLLLRHPEAYLTVRRLRGHPRLQHINIPGYRESLQLENDFATLPNLERRNNWRCGSDVGTEFTDIRLLADQAPPLPWTKSSRPYRERFNVAVLGANREQLFADLRGNHEELCTSEARFTLIQKEEREFHLTVPSQEDSSLPPATIMQSDFDNKRLIPTDRYRNDELRVLARVTWMADRVVLAIDADAGITDSIRDQCRLIRVMRVPSWILVLRNAGNIAAEHRQALVDECVGEIGFPPVANLSDAVPIANWETVAKNISLRPPNVTFDAGNFRQKWLINPPKDLLLESASRSTFQLLSHGTLKHYLSPARSGIFRLEYEDTKFIPGEEVAIIRDNHIFCLGTIQPAEESAESGSP